MAGNYVSNINWEAWTNYTFLQKLSLANNSLENLDDNSFTFLENLQKLDLSLNKIRYNNISENAFKPLEKLTYLDLKQTLPEVLPSERYPASLMQMEELTTLWIDGLGQHPLQALPKLKSLHFSGQYGRCEIPYLERKIFENIKSVEQLFISNCSIEMVESGLLNMLPNISALDLSWNTKMGFDPIANISVGIANRTQFKRLNLNNVYDYFEGNCGVLTVDNFGPLNASHLELLTFEGNNIVRINEDAVKYIPKTLKYTSLRDNMLMFGQYFGELIKTGSLANLVYYDSSQQFHNHIPLNVPSEFSVRLLADNKHRFIDSVITSDCENMFTSYYFKDYFQLIDERLKRFNITPFNTERNPSPFNRIEYLDLSENLPGVIYIVLKMFEQAPFIRFLNLSTNLPITMGSHT
jgi:Leucine-rich repeat (LRR) protein